MSLDVILTCPCCESRFFDENITHNLAAMAGAAGIFEQMWRPDEIGAKVAGDIIAPLEAGLAKLKADPAHFRTFDAPNGWGRYEHFLPFVEKYLEACKKCPTAQITVYR